MGWWIVIIVLESLYALGSVAALLSGDISSAVLLPVSIPATLLGIWLIRRIDARRFYEIVNEGAVEKLDEICAPDMVGHAGAGANLVALKMSIGSFRVDDPALRRFEPPPED